MSLDELIKAANRLDANDLDSLLQQVVYLRARRKTSVLPEDEAQLLLKINQGIPADFLAQYQLVLQKRDAETLTDSEIASFNSALKSNKSVPNVSKPSLISPNSVKSHS